MHPQLGWLAEVQAAVSGASLEEMGCRRRDEGGKGKQAMPFSMGPGYLQTSKDVTGAAVYC